MKVIKLLTLSDGYICPPPCYLASYDPEAFDGRGKITTTADPTKARRFATFQEATDCWKAVPSNHPVRLSDGKPNRPLTAYTIEITDAP